MRGLALCLAAGALVIAGCGSDDSSSSAPTQEKVAAAAGSASAAGVSAKGAATPASLCSPEGRGRPKRQCVAGLEKLSKGKAANPRAACKGLSKKKTKGVRGKSPFAVCVSAAAKLLASKKAKRGSGNGAADSKGNSSGPGEDDATDADATDADADSGEDADPVCVDAAGNAVPFDSEDVEECEPGDTSASDSSDDSSDDDE